ncbi:MAG: T9SS type A sorting domain-containing protein [Flavobacteriaceae bacterium]|nr:T9SS type A sorting domain-containing protein [Flavobacteriaceae bacterium]
MKSGNNGNYTIINELGQSVQTIQLTDANKHSVNIGNLGSGVYFIIGFDNNEVTRQKVVVLK